MSCQELLDPPRIRNRGASTGFKTVPAASRASDTAGQKPPMGKRRCRMRPNPGQYDALINCSLPDLKMHVGARTWGCWASSGRIILSGFVLVAVCTEEILCFG